MSLRAFTFRCCLLSASWWLAACHKTPEPASPTTAITLFAPTSGGAATTLTITGTGFSATSTANTVTINDVAALVQSASTTQLVVVVPPTVGSGPVAVKVAGQPAVIAGEWFHYRYTTVVSTFAGLGIYFGRPHGLAVDAQGNLLVANAATKTIDRLTPAGTRSVLAGSGTAGHLDGPAATAQFTEPSGLAVDAQGNVYVAEDEGYVIRKITPAGQVSTLAGTGTRGYADGPGATAQFDHPEGLAVDAQGNVYVADSGNNRIRRITPAGVVSTYAGSPGTGGFANGPSSQAKFEAPRGVRVDAAGTVYVADANNNQVRAIAPAGTVSTFSGSLACGSDDGSAVTARFSYPLDLALDGRGNVAVVESNGYRVRLLAADGFATTLAGPASACTTTYVPGSLINGPGPMARFNRPYAVAFGPDGVLYVADEDNYAIRAITLK